MSISQNENQSHSKKQEHAESIEIKSAHQKPKQKYNWSITVNYVAFENDRKRQQSYELWIESFFHLSN